MESEASVNFDVKTILAGPPALHENEGELVSYWRIDDTPCLELDRRLTPGMKTVETGAGISTIIFAAHGCEHTCITPGHRETERILTYCRSAGIDTSNVRFIVSRSSDVIHQMSPSEYDLILVDGCHGFPSVFVDFYYAARALKLGGTIVIDDLHISTCNSIARFSNQIPAGTWS
jgi:predicted O-methyltransferase YrrM